MKVLVADTLNSHLKDALDRLGCNTLIDPSLKSEALTDAIESFQPNIIIVRSTKIEEEQISSASELQLIIRAGAGINTIDVKRASEKGIFVSNCPGKNAIAVAELAMGHLINLDRLIVDNALDLKNGIWNKKQYSKAKGLFGKTIAVIGMGSCAKELILRAQAFGMSVRAYSRSLTAEKSRKLNVQFCKTPLEACKGADALSVHLAFSPDTYGIIGELELNSLKNGAYVINTSRGGIIDESALLEAIKTKNIRAGLDVFENEPAAKQASFSTEITQSKGVYGTHHIGASTAQASEMVCDAVIDIVNSFITRGVALNCVNLAKESMADHTLSIRHIDQVGVIAKILNILKKGGHNIQEMENIVFSGGKAACVNIQILGKPNHKILSTIRESNEVFSVSIQEITRS